MLSVPMAYPTVCSGRQLRPAWPRALACLAVLLYIGWNLPCAAAAEPAAETPKAAEEKKLPTPGPVPVPEITAQADAATVNLRAIVARSAADDALATIGQRLPAISREIEARAGENARIVARRPSLDLLRNQERSWEAERNVLTTWSGELETRIEALERDIGRVSDLEQTWNETLALARKEQAPPELTQRVESLLGAVARTRATLEKERSAGLRLQSRVAAQSFRVEEAMEAIRQARALTLSRVLSRDSPPLWDAEALANAGTRIAQDSQEAREAQRTTLESYLQRHADRVLIHIAIFVSLAALLFWARKRLLAWAATEPQLERSTAVVAYPVATALVLALFASRWIYPQAPRLLWAIIGAAALVPAVIILRRVAAPYLRPLLYAVVAFFFIDQVRLVAASIELVPRLIFFAEMLAGTAFLLWFLTRTKRPNNAVGLDVQWRLVRIGAQVACAIFAVTALANAYGYVALANLLGSAVLSSMYFGLILYTAVEILDAIVAMLLRMRPLTLFGMVRRHKELLRRRTRMLLNVSALVWWALFVLDRLAVRDRVIETVEAILDAEITLGAISISLSSILAFVLAVWASFLVSRFVQFVLDEEVFPHAKLKRGLPYAISRTVHYAILVAGFFFAMGVIGVDMTKFTILAGAFTVGVGFGLQNIFNNFVSGLILLFERPVQVGDVIQMDDAAGVVERIGIRASIVRTLSGSEVIVPNGKLISERLVNWTFSDRQRAVEVPVSVTLGTDPERVIALLKRVAAEHPMVLKEPPPEALLVRLGPDWMGFELRAATHLVEDWMKARSELAVAVTAALAAEKIALR